MGTLNFDHVDMDVKLNGLNVYNETISFKKSYVQGDAVSFEQSNFVSESSPSATYVNTYSFRDASNRPIACFFYTFKL